MGHLHHVSKAEGSSQMSGQKACEIWRHVVESGTLAMIQPAEPLLPISVRSLHKTVPISSQSGILESSLMNYWLLLDSLGGTALSSVVYLLSILPAFDGEF